MSNRIQPYLRNPHYWQFNGEPVLLLGGSVEDNLFQIPDVASHLDVLRTAGGNYIRCTMSSRDEGNLFPFVSQLDGLYDLDQFNDEYWTRFETLLRAAHERDIIIQIEVWDRWDTTGIAWLNNPFNPQRNRNYTVAESGLRGRVGVVPFREGNAFFYTVPTLDNNSIVLEFQNRFVDKLLSITLEYPNVLYCIDNETQSLPEWGRYWADVIHAAAAQKGVSIYITEMWEPHALTHPWHQYTLQDQTRYGYFDASQNTHRNGDDHWRALRDLHLEVGKSGSPMPINVVKIYGANTFEYGRHRDAVERFWRHIFCGLASTRFHRPPAGIGLSKTAQAHIHAARVFVERFNIFESFPRTEWLHNRSPNEAFCLANEGVSYAVFFPDGGDVRLILKNGTVALTWLEIKTGKWLPSTDVTIDDGSLRLVTPQVSGYWLAHVEVGRLA